MTNTKWEWPDVILEHRSTLGLSYFAPDDVETAETAEGFFLGRNGHLQPIERGVVYRSRELRHLVGIQPSFEDLAFLHEVKRTFGVEIAASRPRPRRRFSEEEIAELWVGWSTARRERYLAARLRALEWLGTDESKATAKERVTAASWATERALELEEVEP